MSKMVSARVPDALYEQGSIQLAELGSSPSELVNAAFEYLLKERSLPRSAKGAGVDRRRRLSGDDLRRMRAALAACTLKLDIPSDLAYDKRAIADARAEAYEALA